VLIIPEDPTLDRHILKPIVEQIFEDLGRNARVDVLEDPHLGGVDEAVDAEVVRGIIRDRAMFQLFLLLIDRDCRDREALAAQREAEHPGKLLVCLAIEEVEVWMLALHREALRKTSGVHWSEVRQECHPKERYADPLLKAEGWMSKTGRGRVQAMRKLGAQWQGLLQVCPELGELRQRIARWLEERGA
jgi:hypothetical protein